MKIEKFSVVGPLGNGAQSAILQIRMTKTAENFALKVVPLESPEDMKFKEQAEHEFKVAQLFDHPNLIKIYALEPVKDWMFRLKKMHMLIEFVDGKTIDEAPRLSPVRIMQVFEQVASALVHMHKKASFTLISNQIISCLAKMVLSKSLISGSLGFAMNLKTGFKELPNIWLLNRPNTKWLTNERIFIRSVLLCTR